MSMLFYYIRKIGGNCMGQITKEELDQSLVALIERGGEIPVASTTAPGIVQLNDAVNSSSTTQAPTANAVKKVMDAVTGLKANEFPRSPGNISFGGAQTGITTAQFIELLKSYGAFDSFYWISRGTWSYAGNQYITDTGCGVIHLAGCTVEKIGTVGAYTIRIITPTTAGLSSALKSEFVYINNGDTYSPGWRVSWNNHNDGHGSGLDADTLDGVHLSNLARTDSIPVFRGGIGGAEGGEIHLAKPASGTSLAGDIIVDVFGNNVRIFEEGGTYRGVVFDITKCVPSYDIITDIQNLKSSVSSGKTAIASAIAAKGVAASGSDTHATLANKISQIPAPSDLTTLLDKVMIMYGINNTVTGLTKTYISSTETAYSLNVGDYLISDLGHSNTNLTRVGSNVIYYDDMQVDGDDLINLFRCNTACSIKLQSSGTTRYTWDVAIVRRANVLKYLGL